MKGVLCGQNPIEWAASFREFSYDCSNCKTTCCSVYKIVLSDEEVNKLQAELRDLKSVFEDGEGKRWLMQTEEGDCMMLKDGMCSIHNFKPKVCRDYPLVLNLASDGTIKVDCKRVCPASECGVKVDEQLISGFLGSMSEGGRDYYTLQSNSYRNLTRRLREKHPKLECLNEIELLTELALRESIEEDFNPNRVQAYIGKLGDFSDNYLRSLKDGSLKIGDSTNVANEQSPLNPLESLLAAGVRALRFQVEHPTLEGPLMLKHGMLKTPQGSLKTGDLKKPEIKNGEKQKLLEYLAEVSRRGPTSQYVIKSLRDAKHKNVFEAMANYLLHHASAVYLYLNIYDDLYEVIASHEYSLKKRIDVLLS
ncbi:MAG: YkgJ family cysteine cluster protein [Candidatus Altiarchaeota archaeon]